MWFAMLRSCVFLCFWLDNRPTRAGAALRAAPLERGWAIMEFGVPLKKRRSSTHSAPLALPRRPTCHGPMLSAYNPIAIHFKSASQPRGCDRAEKHGAEETPMWGVIQLCVI